MRAWMAALSLVTFISAPSLAARSVTITLGASTALQLTNPTASSINYDVRCYDSSGAQVVSELAQTIAAQNSRLFGMDGKCAGGVAPIDVASTSAGPFRCAGTNVQYSGASSVCGSFYSVCNIKQLTAGAATTPIGNGHWLAPGTNPWSYQISYGSSTTVADNTSTLAPMIKSVGWGNYCMDSAGNNLYGCYAIAPGTNADGAYCCSSGASMAFCKVTVNSTSASSYLTSPQFKGGTPF